jgi:hypothetical protein
MSRKFSVSHPSRKRRVLDGAPRHSGFRRADVAQLVEHSLGKGEVTSSILVISSRDSKAVQSLQFVVLSLPVPWSTRRRVASRGTKTTVSLEL